MAYPENAFIMTCLIFVSFSLPEYSKISAYGKQYAVNPTDHIRVVDEFFIRFTDGNIVEFLYEPTNNSIRAFIVFANGAKVPGIRYRFKIDASPAAEPWQLDDDCPWPKGTWQGELSNFITLILNWGEAGKLTELLNSGGSDEVKHVVSVKLNPSDQ